MLIDDHPLLRQGVASLIDGEEDLEVCCEAQSYQTGLKGAQEHRPDLVILDISLPDVSGIELIKAIKAQQGCPAILVLSVHEEAEFALRALEAGAGGYVMKTVAPPALLTGMRRVLAGELHVSRQFRDRMIMRVLQKPPGKFQCPTERLSSRQLDVFELIGQGFTTREIATRLNMSSKTVETHRGHIKKKLGLNTTGALIRFALVWTQQRRE